MKTTMISSIVATTLAALPLANAWTINACGQTFTGTGTGTCTRVSCAAGEIVDFNAGSPGRAIEFSLYADGICRDEITHFASDEFGYVLPRNLRSFLVLT
ncbi:hypothetical protein BJX68DRAFT_241466 [Aspergillus pseudodeflectus]|uniref:Uncharacterized protein n=1 Tax=Aspergillus pseudodeflectus TaxID=176178 RepID=A0ABR4K4H8_9EURO